MSKRIAFTGGGTAGHVFPGLAVYRALESELLRREWAADLYWIGGRRGMEGPLLKDHAVRFHGIPTGKLRRYFSLRNLIDPFKVVAGFFAALFLFLRERPDLLFSKGGFVAVPPVLAAGLLKIPVFIHESDTDPGLATRITSRIAEKIFVAYEETRDQFPPPLRDKVVVTGNPVRKEILEGDRARGREALGIREDELLLLVLGGSQGALQVNDLIRTLAPELVKSSRILHQMGDLTYKESNLEGYDTRRFIGAELPDTLAAADLVVSRAGAGTLWELASLGKPMVLIPLGSGSSRGDQLKNAEMLEKKGAARVLTGAVTEELLFQVLQELIRDPQKRESLSRGCTGVVRGRADRDIAGFILDRVMKEEVA